MTVVCFSGPSLSPSAAQRVFPEAHCLPPAAQGDLYRACRDYGPSAICLIDGFFEHRPAVSHKELLWALSERIAVYGASSMGALRALELAPHGMQGHGSVHALYASGVIEDDDEVAVVHSDASLDYRVRSDALVNLRATLDSACTNGVLAESSRAALVACARETFYAERSYERLVSDAASILPPVERAALAAWLSEPGRRIDVKRRDAVGLLEHVRQRWQEGTLAAPSGKFEFPSTDAWLSIRRAAREPKLVDGVASGVSVAELLEEAQIAGESSFDEVIRVATWRALCLALAPSSEPTATMPELDARVLSGDDAVDAFGTVAHRRVYENIPGALRVLRLDAAFARRARAKRELRQGAARSTARVLETYFQVRLGRAVPADLDDYAQRVGFADRVALMRALAVEVALMQAEPGAHE